MKIEFLNKRFCTILLTLLCVMNLSAQKIEYNFNFDDFSYCSFYEYKIDKSFNSDNPFLNQLRDEYSKKSFFVEENELHILSAVSFFWLSKKEMIIYYKIVENQQISYHYFYSNPNLKSDFTKIESVLLLQNDAFWQFYNNSDNPKYPEVNRLKPLTKDADGTLNLFKLVKVIEENKNILSKYFN